MPSVMQRDPVKIPRSPGVFLLINKSARCGYVAYSNDLQKRSHSLAHMLQNPKTHWSIKELPKHPPGDFTFTVVATNTSAAAADRIVKATQSRLRERKYRVVDGARSASPLVTYNGEKMSLTEAMTKAKTKAAYITVWRRINRGWTVEQALEVEDPPARWDPDEAQAQKKRSRRRN